MKKNLKAIAATVCAVTCSFGFAACAIDIDNPWKGPTGTETPNYQQGELNDAAFDYELLEDKSGYLVTGIGSITATNISIPATYKGLPVKGIADDAFSGREDIEVIAIGNNIEFIGANAFTLCSGLTSIKIPASVKELGEGAFTNCSKLRAVVFPENSQLSSIRQNTFQNCTSLTSITIPDSVKDIGKRAFQGCSSLRTVVIGEGVTRIGVDVFRNCSALVNVTFGNSVSIIESGAFMRCSSLKSMVLPGSITYMGANMFFGCDLLQSLTIPLVGEGTIPEDYETDREPATNFTHLFGNSAPPSSLKSLTILGGGKIASYAFAYCGDIERIKFGSGVTIIGTACFYPSYGLTTVIISDKVVAIEVAAFYATSVDTVYYEGTKIKWLNFPILSDNQPIRKANVYFYSEEYPYVDGVTSDMFWHYVDGEPVVWQI